MTAPRERLLRWFVPALAGVVGVATLFLMAVTSTGSLASSAGRGALALVAASVLFAVGYRYVVTSDGSAEEARTVAVWTVAGMALLLVLNVWFRLVEFWAGGVGPAFAFVTSMTVGALGGAVTGIAFARASRRAAEREQAQSGYRTLFETAEDGIFVHDPETGTVLDANPRAAELLGTSVEDLEGMSIGDISASDPGYSEERGLQLLRDTTEDEPLQFDWQIERSDGAAIWVEVSLKRATIGDEERVIGLVRDISDRKAHEQELEWADQRFRSLAENTSFGVVTIDETSTIQYANDGMEALLGYPPAELEGEQLTTIIPERLREAHEAGIQRYLTEGTRNVDWDGVELPGLHADGHEILLEVSFGELDSDDERLFTGVLRDIGERKRHAQELEARSEAMEASIDGIALLDDDGRYTFVNEAHADIYGFESPAALVGEHWQVCYGADELERFETEVMPTLFEEGGWRGEATGVRRDGSEFPQELSLSTTSDDRIVCIVRDITERKRHQQQIADLHDATREMLQATDEQAVADRAVETAEHLLEFPITGIWLADAGRERLEPGATTETSLDLFDGQPAYTEGDSLSWRVYETGEVMVLDDLQGEPGVYNDETVVESELIVPLGEYGVLNVAATEPNAFTDNDVALAKLLAANTEVALERVERERDLERQTDQMEFFNSILRHDVLNGITVIRGRASLLAESLEGEDRENAEIIVRWSDDIVDIVTRVRTVLEALTGTGDPELEPVDLSAALRDELKRVRSTYPEATFEIDVPERLPVWANELLSDVLGNVITNAADHNDTEDLTVSVTAEENGDSVTVRIADNGRGVDPEAADAIFRRGETRRENSAGSGFGLFFVESMVTDYGGEVWVEENDEGGATFAIELRSAEADAVV